MLSTTKFHSLLIIAASLLLTSASSSKEPSPSPGKTGKPQQQQPEAPQKPSATDQRATDQVPLVIKVMPTPKTEVEAAQQAEDRNEKSANDRKLVEFTGYLVVATAVLAAIGFFQLIVFGLQARRLRQTVEASADQSSKMERYIAESARAATAMQEVSGSLEINAREIVESVKISREIAARQRMFGEMQMRAYVSVLIGVGVFQERDKGLRFQAKPQLRNTGNTPAHKVSHRIAADILPVPLPKDFKFRLPLNSVVGGTLLAPHQPAEASAVVKNFVPDEDVQNVKAGNGKSLFVWGVVTYKDVFKVARRVTFAQQITFVGPIGKEVISGYYLPKHNRAN